MSGIDMTNFHFNEKIYEAGSSAPLTVASYEGKTVDEILEDLDKVREIVQKNGDYEECFSFDGYIYALKRNPEVMNNDILPL